MERKSARTLSAVHGAQSIAMCMVAPLRLLQCSSSLLTLLAADIVIAEALKRSVSGRAART